MKGQEKRERGSVERERSEVEIRQGSVSHTSALQALTMSRCSALCSHTCRIYIYYASLHFVNSLANASRKLVCQKPMARSLHLSLSLSFYALAAALDCVNFELRKI